MEIYYCDQCGMRISAADLSAGRAVRAEDRNYCPECAKANPALGAAASAGTTADAGAGGRGGRKSRPDGRRPRSTQRTGQPATRTHRARQSGSLAGPEGGAGRPVVFFAAFGGALLVAVIVGLIVLGGRGEGPSDRRTAPEPTRERRRLGARPPGRGGVGGPAASAAVGRDGAAPAPRGTVDPASRAGAEAPADASGGTPPRTPSTTASTTPPGSPASPPEAEPAARTGADPGGPTLGEDFFARLRKESEERQSRQKDVGPAVTEDGRAEPYEQDDGADGLVEMEAEDFSAKAAGRAHEWEFVQAPKGYRGRGAMRALPDKNTSLNSDIAERSPRLDYRITFVKTGVHYLWVRLFGPDKSDDSCHAGFDGRVVPSLKMITSNTSKKWYWEGQRLKERAFFEVPSAGEHTLNIWMREDGAVVDAIVVTSNPDYRP